MIGLIKEEYQPNQLNQPIYGEEGKIYGIHKIGKNCLDRGES